MARGYPGLGGDVKGEKNWPRMENQMHTDGIKIEPPSSPRTPRKEEAVTDLGVLGGLGGSIALF
jgi:hypothetical protein